MNSSCTAVESGPRPAFGLTWNHPGDTAVHPNVLDGSYTPTNCVVLAFTVKLADVLDADIACCAIGETASNVVVDDVLTGAIVVVKFWDEPGVELGDTLGEALGIAPGIPPVGGRLLPEFPPPPPHAASSAVKTNAAAVNR